MALGVVFSAQARCSRRAHNRLSLDSQTRTGGNTHQTSTRVDRRTSFMVLIRWGWPLTIENLI